MLQHVLLDRAHRFTPSYPKPCPGWLYRRDIGAWVDADDPATLMIAIDAGANKPKPAPTPPKPRPTPQSKKADFETGEDMKGP
jgi:hypothetical protein